MSTPAVAPPSGEPLSEGARFIDTFVSPSKTFSDINRSARWWVPFLLVLIVTAVAQFMVVRQVGAERLVENQFSRMPKVMEKIEQSGPEKRDEFMAKQAESTKRSWITAPIGPAVILLLTGLVLWGSYNFGAGQRLTFSQTMAVVSYASLPGIIKSLLMILTAFLMPDSYNPLNPVATNIGYLLESGGTFSRVFLAFVDVFSIWTLYLSALGFTCISKVKMGTSAAIVFGWYLLFALAVGGVLSLLFG
jgi:cytochrome b subunit of formate dehydrogenase